MATSCSSSAPRGRIAFVPGYYDALRNEECKKRYLDKINLVSGVDPYEIPMNAWADDVDLWPSITHVHACMYLILTPSPYSANDMLNYKSLESYKNFVQGWVRQVLVKAVENKRIVIGKVLYI